MFTAIVFAATASAYTPYGLRPGDTYPTREACFAHYEGIDGWTERKRVPNLYSSAAPIRVFETPIGAVFVTCWEADG